MILIGEGDVPMSTIRKMHPDNDDYSVDDILSVTGILKPGEAKELLDHVKESRKEWEVWT